MFVFSPETRCELLENLKLQCLNKWRKARMCVPNRFTQPLSISYLKKDEDSSSSSCLSERKQSCLSINSYRLYSLGTSYFSQDSHILFRHSFTQVPQIGDQMPLYLLLGFFFCLSVSYSPSSSFSLSVQEIPAVYFRF